MDILRKLSDLLKTYDVDIREVGPLVELTLRRRPVHKWRPERGPAMTYIRPTLEKAVLALFLGVGPDRREDVA